MAKRYSDLVSELWSGHSKSITPLKFRVSSNVICDCPQLTSLSRSSLLEGVLHSSMASNSKMHRSCWPLF